MKFAFFGSNDFSKIIFQKLLENNYLPNLIITTLDKPVGRKKIITPPPLKNFYLNLNQELKNKIKLIQPLKLDEELFDKNYDFFLVGVYPKIIPLKILNLPRLKTIGVHPSLLPKYRGPSPIQTALLNGEQETGVTLFILDEKVDHGPIIDAVKYKISKEDDYLSLFYKLADLAGNLIVKNLNNLETNLKKAKVQNEKEATFTTKFNFEDGYIELNELIQAQNQNKELAKKIFQKIKALSYEPGCWTKVNNKIVKILKAKLVNDLLKIEIIQKESKKPQFIKKIENIL